MNEQAHPLLSHHSADFAQVIAVSSGYAHRAKSCITLNLAVCLAKLGKKVCLFDENELSVNHLLTVENSGTITMEDVLRGKIEIDALLQPGPAGVRIIPPTSTIQAYDQLGDEDKQNMLYAFAQLQHDFDYILIDTAAGIDPSTVSFLLGAGSVVITVTPDPASLNDAFTLLKGIKQRVFQQPVKVVVNLVAGGVEARRIINRFRVAVRKYLGMQSGGLSFFIIDEEILRYISQDELVVLSYPQSLPSHILKNISLRLVESGQPDSLMYSNHLAEPDINLAEHINAPAQKTDWLSEAMFSIQSEPLEKIDSIMQKLNEAWKQRKSLTYEETPKISAFELELLKLKTAIHFAGQIDRPGDTQSQADQQQATQSQADD